MLNQFKFIFVQGENGSPLYYKINVNNKLRYILAGFFSYPVNGSNTQYFFVAHCCRFYFNNFFSLFQYFHESGLLFRLDSKICFRYIIFNYLLKLIQNKLNNLSNLINFYFKADRTYTYRNIDYFDLNGNVTFQKSFNSENISECFDGCSQDYYCELIEYKSNECKIFHFYESNYFIQSYNGSSLYKRFLQ